MFKLKNKIWLILSGLLLVSATMLTYADINRDAKGEKGGDRVLRVPTDVWDQQDNTVSNISFPTTNYGIFGLNKRLNIGGGYWPRGSQNQYIFGGGIWFAAKKFHTEKREDGDTTYWRKMVEVTYNPNSGGSWMVPGRIEDGFSIDNDKLKEYRVYFSTDVRPSDGTPYNDDDGPVWPIWDASEDENDTLKNNRYFGYYIYDPLEENRKLDKYPKGPAFISGEDIFCTFKDTDLNYYEGGVGVRSQNGYPLYIQYEHMIYSWGFGDYKDFIFLKYDMINYSDDTLKDCYLAPVLDIDLSRASNASAGAANDRTDFYDFNEGDDTLNLAYQWTNTDRGEKGFGFGYLGFDFLESPAVKRCDFPVDTIINGVQEAWCGQCITDEVIAVQDNEGNWKDTTICTEYLYFPRNEENFIRTDKRAFLNKNQIGLTTFRNWPIEVDPKEDAERYDFISAGVIDGDDGPGDKRFTMTTGPFNIRPKRLEGEDYVYDTVRVVIAIMCANPAVKEDGDGTEEDLQGLVELDKFAQQVYDDNFRAPIPPDRSIVRTYPLNNAVKVQWDSTSELSRDIYEKGMDFLGYRLYRAREVDLDTFDVDQITSNNQYKGPFGWKQIASWSMPTPYRKSVHRSGTDEDDVSNPYIDSLMIVGPVYKENGDLDTMKVRVMKIGRGVKVWSHAATAQAMEDAGRTPYYYPIVYDIDTAYFNKPWGPFYAGWVNEETDYPMLPCDIDDLTFKYQGNKLLDTALVGVLELNSALLYYNPLFWKKERVVYNGDTTLFSENIYIAEDIDTLRQIDTIYFKDSYAESHIAGEFLIDRMLPITVRMAMSDSAHIKQALDSIYKYIQTGKISKVTFPDFDNSGYAMHNVIIPYMDSITNHRTFYDIGDANYDGKISYDDDPAETEKIINNVEYFYKMIAYDEGDMFQPTPYKNNAGNEGNSNVAVAYPAASSAGEKASFKVIYEDTDKLGSLHDFEFFAINQDRVNQLFAGDTLELEFEPYWDLSAWTSPKPNELEYEFAMYKSNMTLRNVSKDNEVLYSGYTYYEASPCLFLYRSGFTENAVTYVLSDTAIIDPVTQDSITFGFAYDTTFDQRSGRFFSGDFTKDNYCYTYSMRPPALGTIGFSYNWSIRQYGGIYRPSFNIEKKSDAVTPIFGLGFDDLEGKDDCTPLDLDVVYTTQEVYREDLGDGYSRDIYGSFNNGPAKYQITFKEGGTEEMTLYWTDGQKTFNVPYLTYEVENIIEYPRYDNEGNATTVKYPGKLEHIALKTDTLKVKWSDEDQEWKENMVYAPDPTLLGINSNDYIGKYNAYSYAWINARNVSRVFDLPDHFAIEYNNEDLIGSRDNVALTTQGRYYLSVLNGTDTLDFVNVFNASGVSFVFDYLNQGRRYALANKENETVDDYTYGADFKAGDQVILSTTGGALGLPLPGAKVRCVVSEHDVPLSEYTDEQLEQVQVVPNPYYVTHQGQKSPYDAKIYFTKLPKECTIDIYTATGDHIKTLEHNSAVSAEEGREDVELWDLMSRNNQRAQSQALIAIIETPNGAKVIRNFSIVVGGFRLISDE